MKLKSVCLFIFVNLMFASIGWGRTPDVFRQGQIHLDMDSTYFTTTENYDEAGEKISLGNDDTFTIMNFSFLATYFLPAGISIAGGTQITYAKAESSTEDKTNSELNEISFLARKLITWRSFRIIPEVGYTKALNEISETSNDTFTSDAADIIELGGWVMTKWQRIYPYLHLSYQSRSRDLSSLLNWNFGTRYKMTSSDIGFEWRGFQSVTDDKYTNSPGTRLIDNTRLSAGSYKFNAVNPSLMDLRFYANFNATKKLSLGAGITFPIMGENTANGNEFQFLLHWFFDTETPKNKKSASDLRQRRKPLQKIKENDNSDDEFEPSIEDYDETLFESN